MKHDLSWYFVLNKGRLDVYVIQNILRDHSDSPLCDKNQLILNDMIGTYRLVVGNCATGKKE